MTAAVRMQWHFEDQHFAGEGTIGILHLRGYLGEENLEQLDGAVDWALTRSSGPIVIDLTHLLGLGDTGKSRLRDAAHRILTRGRLVSICRPPKLGDLPALPAQTARQSTGIAVNDDLTAALRAVTSLDAGAPPHPLIQEPGP
ncbi:hypothetical protein [Actinomadura sp. NPDC048394]|uniref:hypothetical protein n=1 Tax=Actinomadura sp. NPDC048394 TaxID=3158223 RepID=UPI00340DC0F1